MEDESLFHLVSIARFFAELDTEEENELLTGMELIRETVESVIMTGRLKGYQPISLLLIASPECGKTSVVLEKNCQGVIAVTDITGRGLQEICKSKPEISHIIINDMVAINAHKSSVAKYTMSMLTAMTEEGIQATAFPGSLEVYKNGRRGIIASIPSAMVKDGRAWWNKIGLSSRMLPIAFKHSEELNYRIKTLIQKFPNHKEPATPKPVMEFKIPAAHIGVELPEEKARLVKQIAETVSIRFKEVGYRRQKQFRALVCGHALRRTWKSPRVIDVDIDFLERLLPYISYTTPREI